MSLCLRPTKKQLKVANLYLLPGRFRSDTHSLSICREFGAPLTNNLWKLVKQITVQSNINIDSGWKQFFISYYSSYYSDIFNRLEEDDATPTCVEV